MQYLSFSVWLISLSTTPLKPNQVVAGGSFLKVGCFTQCTRSHGLSRNQKGQTLKEWHHFPPADSGRSWSVLWLEQCWVTERPTHVQPWASPDLQRMKTTVQPSEKRTYILGLAANLTDLGLLLKRKTFCLLTVWESWTQQRECLHPRSYWSPWMVKQDSFKLMLLCIFLCLRLLWDYTVTCMC